LWPVASVIALSLSWTFNDTEWQSENHKNYNIFYTSADSKSKEEYSQVINSGIEKTESFFSSKYKNKFDIYIHPNRKSLDSSWQKDWNMPSFKSECWMVASGVAKKLDVISPKTWEKEACEHKYSDTKKTEQLIWHELIHVFHGQLNASPDFSNVEGVDWFVEGLATYASGQCDSIRMAEVKKAISDKKAPISLDNFWTGKLKYGLSGSVVMYIDDKYERNKLKELLPLNKKADILQHLNISEEELLKGWSAFVMR